MNHLKSTARPPVDEIEQLTSDLSAAIWNRIAQLPHFEHLHPKDFPLVYEAILDELKRVGVKHLGKAGH